MTGSNVVLSFNVYIYFFLIHFSACFFTPRGSPSTFPLTFPRFGSPLTASAAPLPAPELYRQKLNQNKGRLSISSLHVYSTETTTFIIYFLSRVYIYHLCLLFLTRIISFFRAVSFLSPFLASFFGSSSL